MKVLSIVFMCLLVGCSGVKEEKPEDLLKNSIENKITPSLHDPSSYEYVGVEKIDSVLYSQNKSKIKNSILTSIETDSVFIDVNSRTLTQMKKYSKDNNEISRMEAEVYEKTKSIARKKAILVGLDSLAAIMGPKIDSVAAYSYLFKFRANNSLGAKVLNEYLVQVLAPHGEKIINITNDPDEIIDTPGTLPGYPELVETFSNKN